AAPRRELAADLVVVLAEYRRWPHREGALAVERDRRADGAKEAHRRVHRRGLELQVHGLRLYERLAGVVHRRVRDVERLQARAPFVARTFAEALRQQLA